MNDNVSDYCCVNTVADNKVMFIREKCKTQTKREKYIRYLVDLDKTDSKKQ